MYLNFGKIYDLNFKFNVAYYPIVGSNSILRHALRVRREECIIIENAILGVEAAKKAEIYCIGVPPYLEPSQLDRADLVIDDHKKLMEHLLGLESAQGI